MVLEVRLSYMWLDGISRSYRLEEATGVRKLWLCKSVCFAPSLASTSTFWFLHAVSDFFSFSHNIAGSFNKALPLPLIAALCQALALQVSVKAPMFLFPLTTEQLSTPRSSHLGYLLQTEGELAIFSIVAPSLSLSAFYCSTSECSCTWRKSVETIFTQSTMDVHCTARTRNCLICRIHAIQPSQKTLQNLKRPSFTEN